jgi:hypothetical protein
MAAIIGDAHGGEQRINDVPRGNSLGDAECAAVSAVLDRLEATPDQQPEGPRPGARAV